MKIALSLLKNYVDLENISPSEIADMLTLAGIEVENIENETATFSNVIAAIVEDTIPHPNADKLKIATVFDGREKYQVVCGAPNCRKGLKTAFAKIGAILTDKDNKDFQIKKCKLRDIESFGMLCSKQELHIGSDHDGIIELPDDIEIGQDLSKVLIDPVFDISLTPNLGHLMNVTGIARELAALLNKKVKYPEHSYGSDKNLSTKEKVNITISSDLCPRYSALYIENIEVKPSPDWLKNYLEKAEIRSINNIVDIMNFTMLETGQPLHAFDYEKIENKKITVQVSKKEEKFTGLDGVCRNIGKGVLTINDDEKIIAIAGIMGGENSAVSDNTTNILIESALFNFLTIRQTSRQLNLRTESSLRFEKNIDPNGLVKALKRTAHLIQMLSPECRIANDIIDIKEKEFEKEKILCRISRVNKILGTKLSKNEIINIFNALEIEVIDEKDDLLTTIIPTYRNDLKIEVDLIEEVARIFGYNNIEKKAPRFTSSSIENSPLYTFEKKIKSLLTAQGMQELITTDLIGPKLVKIVEEKTMQKNAIIEVLHGKSEEQSLLRPSHLPSFLQVVKHNQDHKNFDICAFEIGKVHFKNNEEFIEKAVSALVLSGKNKPHHWSEKANDFDYFDLKGIIENIFHALKIENWKMTASSHSSLHPVRQANIFIDDIDVGVIGEVHPTVLQDMDIKNRVIFAELNNNQLLSFEKTAIKYKELPLYPSSERDWTISLESSEKLLEILKKIRSKLLEKAFIFDIYVNPKDKEMKKNISIRFIYRDKNKTVSFEEVEKEHLKITEEISKKLNIK